MRVLIFEPEHGGHRLSYVRLLIEALSPLGVETVFATREIAPRSAEYKAFIEPLGGQFQADPWIWSNQKQGISKAVDEARALMQSIARTKPDHVYVPGADGRFQGVSLLNAIGRAGPFRSVITEGLLLRCSAAYPTPSVRRRIGLTLSWQLSNHCPVTRMHMLDPFAFAWAQQRHPGMAHCRRLMPDPVPPCHQFTKADARRRLGIPEDGRMIGAAGALDSRKGVDLLVRGFATAKLAPTDRLLLVGRVSHELRPLLDTIAKPLVNTGRVIVLDRFVSDAELELAIAAMDVVAPVYPRHIGSASFVIRAAAAGRPCLGSDWGWVGMTIRQIGLGWTCDVPNEDALRSAIVRSLDDAQGWKPGPAIPAFLRYNSPDNFRRCWTVLIRERLGLDPDPDAINWDQVNAASAGPQGGDGS